VRRLAAAAALALALLPAATAGASVYTDVLHVYQVTGSIPPCRFSSAQLSAALKQIDTYGQQYFADFSSAVQNALTARAGGACSAAALHPSSAALHSPAGVAAPPLPSSVSAPTDSNLPAPILLMAALVVIVAAVLAVRAVAAAAAWEPGWAARWRHAWGEAGYRVGGAWADFTDWLRARR
jgi:hypothetical protein